MEKLKKRLNELRKEKRLRAETMAMAMDQTKSWEKKRKDWLEKYKKNPELSAPAGEIANIIDGLTPDGFDKKGKKVSFVERGKPFTGLSGLKDL